MHLLPRCKKQMRAVKDLSEVPRAHYRLSPKPLAVYAKQGVDPKIAMGRAFASGGYTLKEIAAYFGVNYSTVSWAVQVYEKRANA